MNTESNNDCTAWDKSKLKELVESGMLPEEFYLSGNQIFTCANQFLVPWGGVGIGREKDSFNYHLS